MDITVLAKVIWVLEEDMESIADDYDPNITPKDRFVWGPMSIPVEDIRFYWGQSKNRSVIECREDGRRILIAMPHAELSEKITAIKEEMYQRQLDFEFAEEEDLVIGQEPQQSTDTP